MKSKYTKPVSIINEFESTDVITTSGKIEEGNGDPD